MPRRKVNVSGENPQTMTPTVDSVPHITKLPRRPILFTNALAETPEMKKQTNKQTNKHPNKQTNKQKQKQKQKTLTFSLFFVWSNS